MVRHVHCFGLAACAVALSACTNTTAPGESSGFTVTVAPLSLPGVGVACYDLAIANATESVWARGNPALSRLAGDTAAICSDTFGNGPGGAVSYVGPCDATSDSDPVRPGTQNAVTLWIDGLYDAAFTADIGGWQDPCPSGCTLQADCRENADVPVTFNVTILRAANQGFFDVAVNLHDLFCSAKFDTCDESAAPIELLFSGPNQRAWTGVFGFACTAGSDAAASLLHYSAIHLTCGNASAVVDPLAGPGNASLTLAGHTVRYATYRGAEALDCGTGPGSCQKRYWNLAFNLDDLAAVGGDCSLSFSATASDSPTSLTAGLPAEGTGATPYIFVDAALTVAGAPQCIRDNVVTPDPTVSVGYVGDLAPLPAPPVMCSEFDGTIAQPQPDVDPASCGPCDPDLLPFGGGDGTPLAPYLVCSRAHLENVSQALDKSFLQTVSLNLGASPLTPIGLAVNTPFSGTYDGQGHTIADLRVDLPATTGKVGLFNALSGATVANLTFTNAQVEGNTYAGIVAGEAAAATLHHITAGGSVVSKAIAGGLVGHVFDGSVLHDVAFSGGTVYSDASGPFFAANGKPQTDAGAAGITAILEFSSLTDCSVNGDVTWNPAGYSYAAWTYTGGAVGRAAGATMARCTTSGTVTGLREVGGMVGGFEGVTGSFSDLHSTMTVVGTVRVGGFAGFSRVDTYPVVRCSATGDVTGVDQVGGFSGGHLGGYIEESWATGDVQGATAVGGFIGRFTYYGPNPAVRRSWSSGSVAATGAGPVAGFVAASGSLAFIVSECMSLAPSVTGAANVYGFTGFAGTAVMSSYYLARPTVPTQVLAGVTELTAAQMEDQASFVGWGFPAVWRMSDLNPLSPYLPELKAPMLAWQCGAQGVTCLP